MKISSPRRHPASTPDARWPERRAALVAAITTPTPASQRNSGAANPPRMVTLRNAAVARTSGRVQASKVCASIIIRTAIPRAQSR